MQASGEIRLGETGAASRMLGRKLAGNGLVPLVIALAALIGISVLSQTVIPVFFPDSGLWVELAIILIAVGGFWGFLRWQRHSLIRGWQARGVPLQSPVTFRLAPDALEVEQATWIARYRWPGISELTQTKAHWVYIGPGLAYCLPKRFFANPAEERAFIRSSLEHMTTDARARSDAANAFVGVWE
jgi:hypothetical protein